MTQLEYEQKKCECWKDYLSEHKTTYTRTAFNFAFDRAYALGKQAKAAEGEEMLTVSRKKVQEEYAIISKELSHRDTYAEDYIAWTYAKITFEELFGSKCLPGAEIFDEPTAKNPKETAKTFASNESTDTKSDDFDRIVKDGFRSHNRLHIAAMAMQGILSSDDWSPWRGGADGEIYRNMARAALAHADALIAECEKGGEE